MLAALAAVPEVDVPGDPLDCDEPPEDPAEPADA
jgi:hypothetical protein